jgi:hypothetical protein
MLGEGDTNKFLKWNGYQPWGRRLHVLNNQWVCYAKASEQLSSMQREKEKGEREREKRRNKGNKNGCGNLAHSSLSPSLNLSR